MECKPYSITGSITARSVGVCTHHMHVAPTRNAQAHAHKHMPTRRYLNGNFQLFWNFFEPKSYTIAWQW